MTELSRRILQLSPLKRSLLTIQLAKSGGHSQAPAVRGRGTDARVFPLSFAQERLWFLDQLEPNSAAYNMPVAIRLTGELDVGALERVLTEMVRRHETLRTTFASIEGRPAQVIAPPGPVRVPIIDLSGLPVEEREAELRRQGRAEAQRPFDLGAGPLLRVVLLRLGAPEHVVLVTMHHIISDGWSLGVWVREVSVLYGAYREGRESPLPELPVQYGDYAIWQRQWLRGEVLERELAYWKERLASASPVLELPTDRPRPLVRTIRGASHVFRLTAAVADALKALSRAEGVTLFMTLLAALKVLLSFYSGQDDIVVGTTIATRPPQTESLLGFFVNTLALRTDLSGNPSFRELLRRVRWVVLEAYAHQDLPFDIVVEALQPPRQLGHTPVFQVLMVLDNTPRYVPQLGTARLSPFEVNTGTAKFDLTFFFRETVGGLTVVVEYNVDLFDTATITRMSQRLSVLLESIVQEPETTLDELRVEGRNEVPTFSPAKKTMHTVPPDG